MVLREKEIEFDPDAPFDSCKLDRKKYAEVLTTIVRNQPEGFVLAINNKWGTGKTTFVKMWQAYLAKELQTKPIYFNAWENDFEDNPLRALLGELQIWTGDSNISYKTLLDKASIISKEVIPILSKALLENYIGPGVVSDSINAFTVGAVNILEGEVNEYIKRKESIKDFRANLTKFINEQNLQNHNNGPLVFIVDELDRCRPNYAVLVLEQIKHFFSVDNIVFVLSIDKKQLGHAIRGVYGSEHLDVDEYLRRFIDLEYSIPDPPQEIFFNYLYQQLNFGSFFNNQIPNSGREEENFKNYTKLFVDDLELRKQRKILSHIRLILHTYNEGDVIVSPILLFLVYVKFLHHDFYMDFIKRLMSVTDMHEKFIKIVSKFDLIKEKRKLGSIEGYLLYFYCKNEPSEFPEGLFEMGDTSNDIKLIINSKIDDAILKETLRQIDTSGRGRVKLDTFIRKIELTNNFRS